MADRTSRARLARAAAGLNARSVHAGRVPALALMTDDLRLPDPCAAARALPRGSLVILRTRDPARRARLAEQLAAIAHTHDLLFLIAADPALAARVRADGLHLPEARAREAEHWRTRVPNWIITCAAHDAAAIARAQGCDAVFVAPVFATASHDGAPALGPMRFAALARASRAPVYALGGIAARNAARLIGTGAAGVAAVGALAT